MSQDAYEMKTKDDDAMLSDESGSIDRGLIALTRYIRDEHLDLWTIFKRIGFREYMTVDEIYFVHKNISKISYNFWNKKRIGAPMDQFITLGFLERLADGMMSDADLEGEWAANFIEDRRAPPADEYGHSQYKPVELGWIMALAREVDADPRCWDYFVNLTEFEHNNPRERPLPNPIEEKISQFRNKHCLFSRVQNLGIWPLLYCKHEKYSRIGRVGIDDIIDIEQVKKALMNDNRTDPCVFGGYNLDLYFEDLNR